MTQTTMPAAPAETSARWWLRPLLAALLGAALPAAACVYEARQADYLRARLKLQATSLALTAAEAGLRQVARRAEAECVCPNGGSVLGRLKSEKAGLTRGVDAQ